MPDLASLSRQALARDPGRDAVSFEGRWYTWGVLRYLAASVEAALQPIAGAPVIFVARNHPASLATLLSLIAQGRTIKMLYPFQSAEALARTLGALTAGAVILDARDLSAPVCEAIKSARMMGLTLEGLSVSVIEGTGCPHPPLSDDEPCIEILTSGTTGPPKPFPLSFSLIAEHYVGGTISWLEGDAEEQPPFLLYFPLGNISGIYSTLPTLIRGNRAVLLERFSVAAWHDYVVRHRPVRSGIPPASMRALLDANIPPEDLSSIESMGAGAAPLDPELQRAFEDRYGIPILQSYGATEFGGPVCMWTIALHAVFGRAKIGSVGRPLPGVAIRIVDPETGAMLACGKTGLIHLITPRMGPHWIVSSDMGWVDPDGFLFLAGRADGAIMRGGFKILPETIERALLLHPDVREVSVVAVPDERLGQVPGAAVSTRAGVTTESLSVHLRRHVLATHIPVHWRIVEHLPRTISLKIDRSQVRALFA